MEFLQNVAALIAAAPELKEAIKKAAIAGIEDLCISRKGYCDICDKKLGALEEIEMDDDHVHYLTTCRDHREYKNVFQANVIREKLGYPIREKSIQQMISEL